jgi:hypothetical protein
LKGKKEKKKLKEWLRMERGSMENSKGRKRKK